MLLALLMFGIVYSVLYDYSLKKIIADRSTRDSVNEVLVPYFRIRKAIGLLFLLPYYDYAESKEESPLFFLEPKEYITDKLVRYLG
jgi:hypothetical protein